MSIYRITDITPVGAYMNAMEALREAESHPRSVRGPSLAKRILRVFSKSRNLADAIIRRLADRDLPRNAPEPAE